ncbi:peptidoglycan-binding protein [Streptomyces europaeiscabiei]|uniref:Peptidoglycan-binding protein n=1 Tax=Streptomyces europaeiscabiei TaxID=146819 RepID=A0ABU4N7J5_9ACTN|nr:peptidoglycan-binding protein [Streptomyces europaeiscabiei]MDX2758663.1 peptidoglycan-binding protein [Streptomyces europaeiscabiei]MDX3541751.1 peptidoglycan-binding protein [Streptomyces europaeiscabiei]MDX3550744.1 peptidoglycan-binding protein [Streptomyces europaeiscabiei]MDX3698696.1 peptidoglycan-binding protein [Streptomyces europaeiscabiei]
MTETVTRIDDADGTAPAPPPPRGRRRRRTALIASAVVVAAVAVVGALELGGNEDEGPSVPPRTGSVVSVTRETLTERTTVEGQLGYGTELPLPVKATGTVTWLPEQGTTVERGDELLRVDDRPVILMYGPLPMYRSLGLTTQEDQREPADGQDPGERQPSTGDGKSPGPSNSPAPEGTGTAGDTGASRTPGELWGMDVLQFETNLAALGYTGFTVDERFTTGTAAAVERWQKSLGLAGTGVVGVGDVIHSAGKVRIGSAVARLGSAAGENTLTYTGTARKVIVNASATDASWAVRGSAVTVELPDGTAVKGKVASVGKRATTPDGGGEGGSGQSAATIPVTITIENQKAIGRLESGPVTVEYVGNEVKDVLAVPVAALVALAEGGHGLETEDGRFVAVRTGLFADGDVEVSGPTVREGMKVRIPE